MPLVAAGSAFVPRSINRLEEPRSFGIMQGEVERTSCGMPAKRVDRVADVKGGVCLAFSIKQAHQPEAPFEHGLEGRSASSTLGDDCALLI